MHMDVFEYLHIYYFFFFLLNVNQQTLHKIVVF